MDELEQYGRRENIRIHGIHESTSNKDDGQEVLLNISQELNIQLEEGDIQHVHRVGYKRQPQKRPRIASFLSSKKRNEFMFQKAKLKNVDSYENAFITEDSTPLRSSYLIITKEIATTNLSCVILLMEKLNEEIS